MNPKQLFILGTKLIGLFLLSTAIRELFSIFPHETDLYPSATDFGTFFKISQWAPLCIPVIFALLGTYLIKYGTYVHHFAFRRETDVRLDEPYHYFRVGLTLYGVYLLTRAIVNCFGLMGDVLILLQFPPYMATDVVEERLPYEVVRTSALLGLGSFLLLKEEMITRVAFFRH